MGIQTPIDHLMAAEQPFDAYFARCGAKLADIGRNWPALQAQAAPVVYYYRAAHLHTPGSAEYRRCIQAAQSRIELRRPMAIALWCDLAAMISA